MTDIQAQLLSILVMDLNYDHQPLYGHTPIRHQIAWRYATEGVTAAEVSREVEERKESIRNDREGNIEVRANYEQTRHFDPATV